MHAECLLERTLELERESAPCHIDLYFDLAEDMEEIWIDTLYTPQYLYDHDQNIALFQKCITQYDLDPATDTYGTLTENIPFSNMVVLSVDADGRHIGNVHRNLAAQHLLISARRASPGFLQVLPRRGRWRVSVHAFRIVTAHCTVRITVTGVRTEEKR